MGILKLNEKLVKTLIFFWSLIGFLITVKLTVIYFEANFNPYSLPSFCSINNFIDCDGVAKTTHSQFFGIPLSLWGMFLYLFMIFLLFVDKLKQIKFLGFLEVFKNPLEYIAALGYISFGISMILAGISIFEIKKICVLCIATYIINLVIAIIANRNGFINCFKASVQDFIAALKIKEYLFSFLWVVFLAVVFLSYTSVSYTLAPQSKKIREFKKFVELQEDNPFGASGNILGDKNAKLIVYIYTDYKCPVCRTYNVMISRAGLELGGLKIVHKNLPLDSECNRLVSGNFHSGSCTLSKYAIASERQGHFWDLNTELFEKLPQTDVEALALAKSIGLDEKRLKQDAESAEIQKILDDDITSAINLKIDGTPTMVIKGKIYEGAKPYYELKDILIKAGAFEKEK